MALDRKQVVAALCTIYADLLAVDAGPDDDFFELGGYSLLIVNVVAEAKQQGITIVPDHVFEHKTPSAIAAALSPDGDSAVREPGGEAPDFAAVWSAGLSPMRARPHSPLVTLAEGTGTPVFVFHWGAGNVRFVSEVVDRFRGERPVYGLESVGLWNRERPPLSVVEMAIRYLEEIRRVQPHGPYLLVGPCAGGRIAYEVARQLEAAGDPVGLLAVLNVLPPGVSDMDAGWGPSELYNFRLASLRSQFDIPDLTTDPARVLAAMLATAKIDEGVTAEDLHWRQAVWAAVNFALDRYEPRPYGGEVVVFQLTENAGNPDADWAAVAAGTEVHTFESADTLSLLRDPAVTDVLRKKLAEVPA
ncbi:thioesterase domain-containing protein [Amycolatopsis halotolerans]|uniref:Thioesterase domain-containing protein n=1 Tax=Amycolatopsis halotolerans TaxID=330083 RepID=A0ABV7QDE3_9PSEU